MYSRVGDSTPTKSRRNVHGSSNERLEDVLDDPHCKHLLDYLRQENDPVDESTLARHVVAQITDTTPEEVADEVQRRVQTWLHHGQLPVLDEYGVVEFDADAGEVSLGQDEPTA